MLRHAWAQGVPMRWVTGDAGYGATPALRAMMARQDGVHDVLAGAAHGPAWPERPPIAVPLPHPGGRRSRQRVALAPPGASTVSALVAAWPAEHGQRLTVAAGEHGLRPDAWAPGRVVDSQRGRPSAACWRLARRSITDPTDIAYYLSDAAGDPSWRPLASVAAARWTVEHWMEESKGEVGMEEYEVRYWHSGHRHITGAMLVHAWLAPIRSQARGKKAAIELAELTVPEVCRW